MIKPTNHIIGQAGSSLRGTLGTLGLSLHLPALYSIGKDQARSQKFAIGGLFGGSRGEAPSCRRLGVWGQSSQPPEARGSGGRAPSARNFCIFLQKQLHFRAILIKK